MRKILSRQDECDFKHYLRAVQAIPAGNFSHKDVEVKMIIDAAMQALGSYEGGRMLFLGLGTGLGSALIVDHVLDPMELGHLPYKNGRSYEEYV